MGNIKGESESMKKIALITISLLCSIVILAQGVKGFVNKQLATTDLSSVTFARPV